MASGLRERRAAHTRDEIVHAALALFDERGFDAVTVDEIARAVDVSPRTLFRYFETKASIVLGAFAGFGTHFVEAIAAREKSSAVREVLSAALEEAFGAVGPDGVAAMRQASVIAREGIALRSAASVTMPALDAEVVRVLTPWLTRLSEPQRVFLGISINIAVWMAVERADRPRTSSPRALATDVLRLLDSWSAVTSQQPEYG
jgi:AcrR family transcriptional regulator